MSKRGKPSTPANRNFSMMFDTVKDKENAIKVSEHEGKTLGDEIREFFKNKYVKLFGK
jgi:hypothetical protein